MHFHGLDDTLSVEDCRRFELLFGAAVRRLLGCGPVAFLVRQPAAAGDGGNDTEDLPRAWEAGARLVQRRGRPVVDAEHRRLYLPLFHGDRLVAVVIAEEVAADILAGPDRRLAELAERIARECVLLRRWAVDPITGLGTGNALVEELDALAWEKRRETQTSPWLTVALLEIVPDFRRGMAEAVRRTAARLRELLGEDAPLYHFGGGLFAMIWNDVDVRRSFAMANTVLAWMRNRKQGRASLGMETVRLGEDADAAPGRGMVERALAALDRARRRGPTALCNYSAEDAAGRLAGPPTEVQRALARHWRGRDRFAVFVVREQAGSAAGRLSRKLLCQLGEVPVFACDETGEAWGVLVDVDRPALDAFIDRIRDGARRDGRCFLLGAALYPCPGFRKGQIPANARKALVHASFYGDNGVAVFDDVSCNISGDIYYEDGNLAAAVQEYRHGLRLNPDSVNLNNSLGVCYAQMGFDRRAIPCFRRVLDREPDNFMALFNLGLALRQLGRGREALAVFERAHALDAEHTEVLRQLGLLALDAGRYQEAVGYLERFCTAATATREAGPASTRRRAIEEGRALYALAEALRGAGDEHKAIGVLERAIRVDPRNGRAMGLLAELYGRHGQGDDIALSLARQAVALDGDHAPNWWRLAEAALRLGNRQEAREAARQCLARQADHGGARSILAEVQITNEDNDKEER